MQQIYWKTLMPKCDFNKVALQLYWNHLRHACSPVNLLHIFRTTFPKNVSRGLLLNVFNSVRCLVNMIIRKEKSKVKTSFIIHSLPKVWQKWRHVKRTIHYSIKRLINGNEILYHKSLYLLSRKRETKKKIGK